MAKLMNRTTPALKYLQTELVLVWVVTISSNRTYTPILQNLLIELVLVPVHILSCTYPLMHISSPSLVVIIIGSVLVFSTVLNQCLPHICGKVRGSHMQIDTCVLRKSHADRHMRPEEVTCR